jgi:murein DD-endopeptidase MepM/ murein hydrolase activator NlpD
MRIILCTKIILIILLILSLPGIISINRTTIGKAQVGGTPFLITPYYGNKEINSSFDHQYPTYSGIPNNGTLGCTNHDKNGIFKSYDGSSWGPNDNVDIGCCILGTNCYDGHPGYDFDMEDFDMDYEPVLSAADGTVISAEWDNPNCHNCGYGLIIIISTVTRVIHIKPYTVTFLRLQFL